jgi:hypothetical protein
MSLNISKTVGMRQKQACSGQRHKQNPFIFHDVSQSSVPQHKIL